MDERRNWFVGVDWASETHHVCVLDGHGDKLGERGFRHSGAGLAEMADWILKLTGGEASAVHVAIEVPHGPVVESLIERGFAVHAINPKQLDRFRDRFSPAGAKDDIRDAHVLGDALRTDPRCLRRLAPVDPVVIELREWSRIAEDLSQERARLANRARQPSSSPREPPRRLPPTSRWSPRGSPWSTDSSARPMTASTVSPNASPQAETPRRDTTRSSAT